MKSIALAALLFYCGCSKPLICTSEVSEGDGTHRASVRANSGEAEPALRRRAIGAACEHLCEGKADAKPGCRARCQVDVEAGKVGARVRCAK